MGGFAYQVSYAVARLATLATGQPALDLDDVPVAIRFDWAEDIDERLEDGRVVFTQCKRIANAAEPARLAEVMLGFAPKLLWAGPDREDLVFRLVSTDERFGRAATAATKRSKAELEHVRAATIKRLLEPPQPQSDRSLWQEAAGELGFNTLVDALWARLEFVYVGDTVARNDAAGPLFPAERDALNLLLSGGLTHAARQAEALRALRALVHGDVVAFDPAGEASVAFERSAPQVIDHQDLVSALISYRCDSATRFPLRVVDRVFLDIELQRTKQPFIARSPEWRDVVHGDDPDLRFIERDETASLCSRVRTGLLAASSGREGVGALFVVGAPGAGKSTIVRRVAAILAAERCCTVADPGIHVDRIDDTEAAAIVEGVAELARSGRPVLFLLDDPLFAGSRWPDLLRRFRWLGPVFVLGATPSLLFDQYSHQFPNSVSVDVHELGPPSTRERSRLWSHHGRESSELEYTEDEFIVLAMEASAGQSFDEIIDGIWRTLNDGRPIDPTTPPISLPWLVRVFLIVCFCHQYYVAPRELLIRTALQHGAPPPAEIQLTHELGRLISADGWHVFRIGEASWISKWAGPSIESLHARVARSAWERRPVPGFDVADWILPAVVQPGGSWEIGRLLATMLTVDPDGAAALCFRLEALWQDAIESGAARPRDLTLFVGSGKALDPRFPDFDGPLRTAAKAGGSEAWLAALSLALTRGETAFHDAIPDDISLRELLSCADFSVAEGRARKFGRLIPTDDRHAFIERLWTMISSPGEPTLKASGLPLWLVRHEPADQLEAHLPQLLSLAGGERRGWSLLALLVRRAEELSVENLTAIAAVGVEVLMASKGDKRASALAAAVNGVVRRGETQLHDAARTAISQLGEALRAWEVATPERETLPPLVAMTRKKARRSQWSGEKEGAVEREPRARPAIIADVLERLVDNGPIDVAAWLAVNDAPTAQSAAHVCNVLREYSVASGDSGPAAAAAYLLRSVCGDDQATACRVADLAFIGQLNDAPRFAHDVLLAAIPQNHASVVGRVSAIAAIEGTDDAPIARLVTLRRADRVFALIALWRMLGADPHNECRAWQGTWRVALDLNDAAFRRLITLFASGRVLAIRRALGSQAPSTAELVSSLLPAASHRDLERVLEGTLFAWAAKPDDVWPKLLPYQVVSMHETLVGRGRVNRQLEARLAQAVSSHFAATPQHIEAFAAWRSFSSVAAKALNSGLGR
jgi:hypothetical protein